MLQLDNNNSQRGPVPHGSDINQTVPTSPLFPSSSLTNGNGLAVSVSAHSALNGGPGSFMGLSAGAPPPHGPLSAGIVPQGPGVPSVGSMIHWGTGSSHHLPLQTNTPLHQAGSGLSCNNTNNRNNDNNNNDNSEDEDDDDYRPFTPPPPRERLSYTRYQLELLNGIYNEVRYPNSTQKQLIAKRVGITREQVKIWFQNRRRKDVVSKGGKPEGNNPDGTAATTGDANSNPDISDNSNGSTSRPEDAETEAACSSGKIASKLDNGANGNTNDTISGRLSAGSQAMDESDSSESKDKMVSTVVLNSIIAELQKFNNEYLKQKKNRKKNRSKKNAASLAVAAAAAAAASSNSSSSSCKSKRLFQSYDMIAPPNKVTPTAFLNTSANRFKHAGGTSAFQNPREHRLVPIPPLNLGDNRLWDGFGLTNGSSFPSSVETSDLFQQRSPADPSNAIPGIPSSLASSFGIQHQTPHQQAAAFSGLLSGSMAAVHHLNAQTTLYDNLPVLSDLLNSYKSQQSASVAAAAAVAHRQQLQHSLLSSTSGSPGRPQPPTQSFFHNLSSGPHSTSGSLGSSGCSIASSSSTNNNTTSDDSSKSPLSDLTFPSPTAPPTHPFPFSSHHHHHHPHPHSHPHSSTFPFNRVFPFPLIADPPVMLSTIRQSDSTFRTHPPHQWPHPPSSLGQTTSPVGQTFGPSQISPPSSEDPYRPLLISSLNNPYFSPSSSNNYPSFSPTSLPPPPQHNWPTSPSGTDSTEFAQL